MKTKAADKIARASKGKPPATAKPRTFEDLAAEVVTLARRAQRLSGANRQDAVRQALLACGDLRARIRGLAK